MTQADSSIKPSLRGSNDESGVPIADKIREPKSLVREKIEDDDNFREERVTKKIKKASRAKKNYNFISDTARLELIDAVKNKKEKIKHAAKRLGINYSSAKSICQIFEREGSAKRILVKKKGLRECSDRFLAEIQPKDDDVVEKRLEISKGMSFVKKTYLENGKKDVSKQDDLPLEQKPLQGVKLQQPAYYVLPPVQVVNQSLNTQPSQDLSQDIKKVQIISAPPSSYNPPLLSKNIPLQLPINVPRVSTLALISQPRIVDISMPTRVFPQTRLYTFTSQTPQIYQYQANNQILNVLDPVHSRLITPQQLQSFQTSLNPPGAVLQGGNYRNGRSDPFSRSYSMTPSQSNINQVVLNPRYITFMPQNSLNFNLS